MANLFFKREGIALKWKSKAEPCSFARHLFTWSDSKRTQANLGRKEGWNERR